MMYYVAGFLFTEDFSEVVLIRKNKPSWQAGKLNAVGGKVEQGEAIQDAMRREFIEEANIDLYWSSFCNLHGKVEESFRVYFFYAILPKKLIICNLKSMTDEQVDLYPISHTEDRMPNLRWLIPMAVSLAKNEDRAKEFDICELY